MENFHNFLCILILVLGSSVSFSNNPVRSIIYLISTFSLSALVCFIFNLEFFGLLFIIIYVGAVAVLFLFIIMMVEIKSQKSSVISLEFLIIFNLIIFFLELNLTAILSSLFPTTLFLFDYIRYFDALINIDVVSQVLYNYNLPYFLIAGLILFVSLVGSVVLTLKFSLKKKAQNSFRQLSRENTIF